MKGMDLFCASPASTAICSSMDQRAMVRHGTRTISRHFGDHGGRRKALPGLPLVPCTSQLPIDPKTYYQKNRKSAARQDDGRLSRKSSADIKDLVPCTISQLPIDPKPYYQRNRKSPAARQDDGRLSRKSSADVNDLTSPPGSSRYLLSETPFVDWSSDSDHVKALVPRESMRPQRHLSSNDITPCLKSSSSTRSRPQEMVVELRVSIHCKGCEGKVRKHISGMKGVRSFRIDLATKKVTIIGDVTPLSVLTSISRVKNAQFWPSPTSSSPSSPASPSPMVRIGY